MTPQEHKLILLAIYKHELSATERLIADELPEQEAVEFISCGISETKLDPNLSEARQHWRFRHIVKTTSITKLWGGTTFFGWWSSPFFKYGRMSTKIIGSLAWLTTPILLMCFSATFLLFVANKINPNLAPLAQLTVFVLFSILDWLFITAFFLAISNNIQFSLKYIGCDSNYPYHPGFNILMNYFISPYRGDFKKRLVKSAEKIIPIRPEKQGGSFEDCINGITYINHDPKSIITGLLLNSIAEYAKYGHPANTWLHPLINKDDENFPYGTEAARLINHQNVCEKFGDEFIRQKESSALKATYITPRELEIVSKQKSCAL